ncbi:MAG: hypothetical protein PHN84_12360 [Desulfuromonadaceae bacterium]|nr:hypothetical protein [Desulfuromonadaceae bacterium]MDD2856076.1 hypothetical protein [Desulfuromonadaceae bacterium]
MGRYQARSEGTSGSPLEENSSTLEVSTECQGTCGKVFKATGVAVPPTIRAYMDGYAPVAALRELNPKLPIIISSGFGDADVTSKIGGDNITGLISKPYDGNRLRGVLKQALEVCYT